MKDSLPLLTYKGHILYKEYKSKFQWNKHIYTIVCKHLLYNIVRYIERRGNNLATSYWAVLLYFWLLHCTAVLTSSDKQLCGNNLAVITLSARVLYARPYLSPVYFALGFFLKPHLNNQIEGQVRDIYKLV